MGMHKLLSFLILLVTIFPKIMFVQAMANMYKQGRKAQTR
jgi:hypothetical protein